MKRLPLFAITLLSFLVLNCTNIDLIPPQQCTLNDLAGTWIWVTENNEPVPSSKIEIGTIKVDGTEEYWTIKDNKWTKTIYPISIKDGILTLGDVGECYIVSCDRESLTIQTVKDNTRYTAEKVSKTENKLLYGAWICDSYTINDTQSLSNYQIVFNEDSTYVITYDNADSITGKYYIYNDFLIYESNRAGSFVFNLDIDDSGPTLMQDTCNDDGSFTKNLLHKQSMRQFTLNDVVGTWLTVTRDGQQIPIREATICYAEDNSGHSVISGIENNIWVSRDVQLSVNNNILTRVIDNTTDYYTIIYFDKNTIIWKSHQDGSVTTRKNISTQEDYEELIRGYWKNDSFTFLVKGDSAIVTHIDENNVSDTRRSTFKIYGDIMVLSDDTSCNYLIRVYFGYDVTRNERYMTHTFLDTEGNLDTQTFYKPSMSDKLAGGWIWDIEDNETLSTIDLEISFYNPITGEHDYQTFGDGAEHIVEPFYMEGRKIVYPEDTEVPYETIISMGDSTMVVVDSDGISYGASRIFKNNPLKEKLIGVWNCQNFQIDDNTINITHSFYDNGLLSCTINEGTPVYGTYKLLNNFLILEINSDTEQQPILWQIKNVAADNSSMTFYQLLEDGTTLQNVLIKE